MIAKSKIFIIPCLTLLLLGMSLWKKSQQYTITVSAGGLDRIKTVVSFSFPQPIKPGLYKMKDVSGRQNLLQVDHHNVGWFILKKLPADSSITYSLSTNTFPSSSGKPGITYTFDSNTVTFQKDERKVLSYYYAVNNPPKAVGDVYRRAGYIHPAYSPAGIPLTNHLDTTFMHPHLYSIWSAWTHTKFQGRTPDFWNVDDKTGRVKHTDSLEAVLKGPIVGGLQSKNYFVDLTSSTSIVALNEGWDLKIYNTGGREYHMFDLAVTQTANTDQPLILPEYRYGGVAIRGNKAWDNSDMISFLTSKGYNRKKGNATRARWVYMGGQVDGKEGGIAVLGHPDNYWAPQPVRIHPEIPYFVFAPTQLGKMTIDPGSPYVARYRYLTFDNEPDSKKLNRLWNDYAYPLGVTVEVP